MSTPTMQEVIRTIDRLRGIDKYADGKLALRDLGFISCAKTMQIRHVPFYEPCMILVLSGRKTFYKNGKPVTCEMGSMITVPAPGSYDLRNDPDQRNGRYSALIIPFKTETLDRVRTSHNLLHDIKRESIDLLKFKTDDTLFSAIQHYLTTIGNPRLLSHRLMEILLILATRNSALLSYTLHQQGWTERVRAIVATDLSRSWDINEVCERLATSESTLRRHLKKENITFRELVYELRLASALMQLLQTNNPVQQIAYECGYKSVSRFSSNFHKRFGMPPKEIRVSVNESEY